MKILQITTLPADPIGGLESVVYNLSKQLTGYGHNVAVLTSSGGQTAISKSDDQIKVFSVPSIELNSRLVVPKDLGAISNIISQYEIVHVHSPDGFFTVATALLAKILGKLLVVSILSYLDLFKHPTALARLIAYPVETATTLVAEAAKVIHIKNVYDYAKLSRFRSKVIYIPDGIPEEYFKTPHNAELIRREIGLDNEKVVLYVGRLHRLKGPDVLIRAMKHVVEVQPKAVAVLVGPGSRKYQTWLEELVTELGLERHIVFAGVLTEKKKMSAYDAADVVVVPSCSDVVEAYSLVTSEGWARGKPVVASAVGALKYRITSGVNGFLVKPNDPRELAEKIVKSFDVKVKKIPQDVWSWNKVAKKFEELYESIATCAQSRKF